MDMGSVIYQAAWPSSQFWWGGSPRY